MLFHRSDQSRKTTFALQKHHHMFTLEQIMAAHSKVRSGADFPRYIQELKELGLTGYSFNVEDGSNIYYNGNGYTVYGMARYNMQDVSLSPSPEALQKFLKAHQQGQSDFSTFCKQAADTGVMKWLVDMQQMTCSYLDHEGNVLLEESIPQAA